MKNYNWVVAGVLALVVMGCSTSRWETPGKVSKTSISPEVRACPDWSANPVSNYSNEDFSNLGCSTSNNLYVQLRDKNDYKRGSSKVVIDPNRDSVALQGYMSGVSAGSSADAVSASTSR